MQMQMLLVVILVRFWGWSENKREEERDFAELSQLAREGKPLYGESHQPQWVQNAAYSNSGFSQLKFSVYLYNSCINPMKSSLSLSLVRRCFPNVSLPPPPVPLHNTKHLHPRQVQLCQSPAPRHRSCQVRCQTPFRDDDRVEVSGNHAPETYFPFIICYSSCAPYKGSQMVTICALKLR